MKNKPVGLLQLIMLKQMWSGKAGGRTRAELSSDPSSQHRLLQRGGRRQSHWSLQKGLIQHQLLKIPLEHSEKGTGASGEPFLQLTNSTVWNKISLLQPPGVVSGRKSQTGRSWQCSRMHRGSAEPETLLRCPATHVQVTLALLCSARVRTAPKVVDMGLSCSWFVTTTAPLAGAVPVAITIPTNSSAALKLVFTPPEESLPLFSAPPEQSLIKQLSPRQAKLQESHAELPALMEPEEPLHLPSVVTAHTSQDSGSPEAPCHVRQLAERVSNTFMA